LNAAANAWSWLRHRLGEPVCCDHFQNFGFPFTFHRSGGITGRADFFWSGLLLDIVVAWTIAVLLAWIELGWRRRSLRADNH